jgi:hypothetical protein
MAKMTNAYDLPARYVILFDWWLVALDVASDYILLMAL